MPRELKASEDCVAYVRWYCAVHMEPGEDGQWSIYLPSYPDGCDFLAGGRWVARAYNDGTWDKVDLTAPHSWVN